MSDLNELAKNQNREALLLVEVAAWLHDYFKHTDQHIDTYVSGALPKASGKQNVDDLIPLRLITLLGKTIPFSDARNRKRAGFIDGYLNRCHFTAHIEKQEGDGPQYYPPFLSSPFGFECDASRNPPDLTRDLRTKITWPLIGNKSFTATDRDHLQGEISKLFSRVGGDTRRPANEITLWEWGHSVGTLYKAALAGALLGFEPLANDLRWRLLSIRFDGFSFFTQSARLPDLLARRNLLFKVLDEIRQLLEITYPIGTEVYRDENGSVFVVPGCEKEKCSMDLLALQGGGKTLRKHILDNAWVIIEGELVPDISLDQEPWYGQDPEWSRKQKRGQLPKDELPLIPEHLKPAITGPESSWVNQRWNDKEEQICTVCGLRPQGYGAPDRIEHYHRMARKEDCPSDECQTCKAISRGVCSICEQRRADRSQEWATEKLSTTIWIDEVADANARIALIVGHFDLTHWLSGDLVRTLAVCNPVNARNKTANEVAKNPSFARLRRIWETTHRFWQDVCPTNNGSNLAQSLVGEKVDQVGPRLAITPKDADKLDLGHYHAFNLVLSKDAKMSVVWDPKDKRFIICDNLNYLESKGQLELPVEQVLKKGGTFDIEESVGYGAKSKDWGKITLTSNAAEVPNSTYTPAIPILAEPRTFMALVPADKALQVVETIKTKYEREMGKVRNRLPLHLGIVYAGRRTPLRAVLDAGRRMLSQSVRPDGWKVVSTARKLIDKGDHLPEQFQDDKNGQFHWWFEILLEKTNDQITWYVPAAMGDVTTPDEWYPYVFLSITSEPKQRNRRFSALNPFNPDGNSQLGWLVHAGDLKQGDIIYFTPATLDWVWLDSAAGRRFEIAYNRHGQRCGLPRRPYLLDGLEFLEHIWETLKHHLSMNQIYAIRDLIEAKRDEWQVMTVYLAEFDLNGKLSRRPDDVFWQFCYDTMANAEWREYKKDDLKDRFPWEVEENDHETWLAQWANHAARGWLTDVVELYLQIMKEEI